MHLLKKSLEIGPDADVKRTAYSVLGRAYVALEEYDEALQVMPKAYDLFNPEKHEGENFPEQEYKTSIKAYSLTLHKTGDSENGDEIAWEAENMDIKS